jgi:RNase P subunit RPR2
MAASFLACSNCHEVVIKSVGADIKVRSKVLIAKDTGVYAVCKGCGVELEVPFKFDRDLAKSLSATSGPRLYLKK